MFFLVRVMFFSPSPNQSLVGKKPSSADEDRWMERRWEIAAILSLLHFCCTKGNFHIPPSYKFELSCCKHMAVLFRALW